MPPTKQQRHEIRAAQLDKFCQKHHLDKSRATIAGGFRKDVLLFADEVYCLPFSEASNTFVRREHAFFRSYHGKTGIEIPRFLRSFHDEEFCPYDIGVISRIHGDPLHPTMESMDWEGIRAVFLSFADAAAGWHSVIPDSALLQEHGRSFANISPLPVMNQWLSWLLHPHLTTETVAWTHDLLLQAAKKESLSTAYLERPATLETWQRAFAKLSELTPVILHADVHDGQLILAPGSSTITGVIDWDNFCMGNPLVDFNTCKWFPDKMWAFRQEFRQMRREMWQRYLRHRGITGLWAGGLDLFCHMTEAVRVLCEKEQPRIWMTKGPYPAALREYLQHLETAAQDFAD